MITSSLSRTFALWFSVALTVVLLGILSAAVAPSAHASASPVCMEDQPCYRWDTMGNRSRGIFVIGQRSRVIVSTCGYARLHARIDWQRTYHVRGDYVALRRGCKS